MDSGGFAILESQNGAKYLVPIPRNIRKVNTASSSHFVEEAPEVEFKPDISSFLESNELSDVTIMSRKGTQIPAHRLVLAAGSPVFRAMFGTEMRENAEGVVRIEDMGTKSLKLLLKFLYTGSIKKEVEDLEGHGIEEFLELVYAGDKYNIPPLMSQAGVALSLRVNRENAVEIFRELKKYGDELKKVRIEIAKFIQTNICAPVVIACEKLPQNSTNF